MQITDLSLRAKYIHNCSFFVAENEVSNAPSSYVLNCPKCTMPFATASDLQEHLEVDHGEQTSENGLTIVEEEEIDDIDEEIAEGDLTLDGENGKRIVVSCIKKQNRFGVNVGPWEI